MSTDKTLDTLVIVCCHAIYLGRSASGREEDEWLIAPFQKGETPTFIAHIDAGMQLAASSNTTLLVFSGGPTKQSRTYLSEAQSYLNYVRDNSLDECLHDPNRIAVEPLATDSYQNLLFSYLLFLRRSKDHLPPRRLFIISHDFKRRRFLELHVPGLRLPQNSPEYTIDFIGINPPEHVSPKVELEANEETDGWGAWKEDLYGARSVLKRKRDRRGYNQEKFKEGLQAWDIKSEVVGLLDWEGGESGKEIYGGGLPWIKQVTNDSSL